MTLFCSYEQLTTANLRPILSKMHLKHQGAKNLRDGCAPHQHHRPIIGALHASMFESSRVRD